MVVRKKKRLGNEIDCSGQLIRHSQVIKSAPKSLIELRANLASVCIHFGRKDFIFTLLIPI